MPVISDRAIRIALWLTVALNALGTGIFGLAAVGGSSPFLPVAIPRFAAGHIAWVIALFGVLYAWQAMEPHINRGLIAIGGVGKLGFFLLTLAYSVAGDIPAQMAANAAPDLLFGVVFLAWAHGRGA
jgi:hypothetical protein